MSNGSAAPRASALDTLGVLCDVVLPLVAQGAIIRRPRAVGLAQRLAADRRSIRRLVRLRERYGAGPLLLRVPGRDIAVVLSPGDVHRVLVEEPEAFTAANREKRAALSHFQPRGVLISEGSARSTRRAFNEAALDADRPAHRLAAELVATVRQETDAMLDDARGAGALTWDVFAKGWWRIVRRVVLGDGARDDHAITDTLARLRRDANWAWLRPQRTRLRARLHQQLAEQLARAEEGSLAELIAALPTTPETAATDQVCHWLFAFDAAGMASFRALALLDAHPSGTDLSTPQTLSSLRATVLESLRLWPTTPAVLRDSTTETTWESGILPRGTALVVFAPFFHRDTHLPYADRFVPEIWSDGRGPTSWPLIPFSDGPAACPGRNLVLLLTSSLLAELLERHQLNQMPRGALDPVALPPTLSPFTLCFELGSVDRRIPGSSSASASS